MIHGALLVSGDLRIFHQMQVVIDLDRVVKRMSGLKGRKLGIRHHCTPNNTNGFTFPDRLEGEHPLAAYARRSKFNSRVNPGLWKIGFHSSLFLLPLRLVERQLYDLRWRMLAVMLHRDLHSHICPDFVVWLLQVGERDVFFQ